MTQEKQKDAENPSSYKESLNLLKTGFGMRANSTVREPEIQKFWIEKGIDLSLGKENKGEIFTLHDGPPYANGALHMGHALNKVLKDVINKYKIMNGFKVRFIPGWDCHGLPIELKVLQNLSQKERFDLSPISLRKKAALYAKNQIDSQMLGFKRWGVWGDWEKPYLTLQKEYEAEQIRVFGKMALKGYIYRGLKPVHWSPSSRTALAEAELEYPEGHISPSVYVGFSVTKIPQALDEILIAQGLQLPRDENKLSKTLNLAIWTTTPWTLPANVAVSINETIEYSFVSNNSEKIYIIASELLSELEQNLDCKFNKIACIKGTHLVGILYKHPFLERISPVVIGGDYITTQSGTGLVHTAPGHGMDDFATGINNNLPIICPVNEKGIFTSAAGRFEGLNVLKDANQAIINELKSLNLLLKEVPYAHKYPYDWRTKKPTIFRATEQWFASVEGFRDKALKAIDKVEWLPRTGKKRISSMVKERGDWCISRQRIWGVPIPVFYKKDGSDILLNETTINHIQKLFSKYGADIWWEFDESKLLPPELSSEANNWRKGTDTMDVWFDSGSSWASVIASKNELNYPADLYLEGTDQHRGWFQSSLLTSVAANDKAPYKKVLTHGFALDENGRKMSKSLGNIIDPSIIINGGSNKKLEPAFGADVLRLWVSSVDYSADVPIGSNILKQISDVYRKVRNTSRYLLGNLHDFDPLKDSIIYNELPIIDQWILHRTSEIIEEITLAFENYEFYKFFQLIQSYCVVDLSNFYLDIAKDRLYVSAPDDYRRRSCQTVMALIIERLASLISPVLCHMAEDIWQNIPYALEEESVFQRGWPKVTKQWQNNNLNSPISIIRELRTSVNRVLEECRNDQEIGSSLEVALRIEPDQSTLLEAINFLYEHGHKDVDNLRDWLLVSNLQIGGEPWAEILNSQKLGLGLIEITKARGHKCARCWHYEPDIGSSKKHEKLCARCIDVLSRI